jgi:hypothetical protein
MASRRARRRTRKQRGGSDMVAIYVVYFAHINLGDEPWEGSRASKLISEQLTEAREWGLAEKAKKFDIVLTSPSKETLKVAEKAVKEIIKKADVTTVEGNPHEQPGLLRVWEQARDIPEKDRTDSVILYFHSKGMMNGDKSRVRTEANENMTREVIKPWESVAKRFKRDPLVNKAGFTAANDGFIWHNFWWARASYLIDSPRPAKVSRRHYYEDWLGRRVKNQSNHNNVGEEKGMFVTGAKNSLTLCVKGADGDLGLTVPGNVPDVPTCFLGM